MMGPTEPVRDLIEPLITAAGLEVWDIELRPGLLRILVDRPGGVDLDTIGQVSEAVSRLLDGHDVGPVGRYLLEVSSPGVERPLRTPDQYRRFVGTVVAVKTTRPLDGSRRFQGVLVASDDAGIVLDDPNGSAAGPRRFAYDQIQQARTVLAWGPSPKPGRKPGRRSPRAARATAGSAAAPTAATGATAAATGATVTTAAATGATVTTATVTTAAATGATVTTAAVTTAAATGAAATTAAATTAAAMAADTSAETTPRTADTAAAMTAAPIKDSAP
jgi:ribosome maturation factor RimP